MRFQKEINIFAKDAILKRFQTNETNFSEEYDNKEHSNIKRQDRSPVPGYPERQ